ncbi:nitrogen regulation protein NR(II) [Colwellia sp. UCD-KL20]|uniref:nitrogen regulation protein NR(II) n=1 Tax=Colwellia sp. UCD-KL20 TaxID=1917165 RepID=UPI0009711985|nr:nitrogen regulation protein NR(II) [Colwellia sp. UCD-KL20]
MLSNLFKIQQNKKNFQQVLASHMVTAVMLLDEDLVIQYLNPAAEAILVKSLNTLYNQSIEDVFRSTSIKKERFIQLLSSGQEFNDCDVTLEFIDHSQITIELTASSIEFNNSPHILLEFKQIDQQKQISAEAFQQQQWESARDLIRGLAHEIKNPLGGLRGAAQLLDNDLSGEQQEYTAMIIEQADRLTNLVDRLLGPNQLPKITKQNIHVVLEKVNQLVNFNNPKGIKVYRDYDPSIPDIEFDEDKIQQAILNIVNNAIQAIEGNNTILLKTRVASNQIINGKRIKLGVQISIIDDGPGIPDNIQDTLFYPMVSGRNDGTGLGLSICQTLIHQHQGKLLCTSQPGKTEFTILLPIHGENEQ